MLLSICVPSYNRFEDLKHLLYSINQAKSSDFDVYIIDNGSPTDFEDDILLDERFHFIKRKIAVPGPINIRTSLNYGDGKYRMLCLDKDYIDGRYLDLFITKLKSINSPCGYCLLSSDNDSGCFRENLAPIEDTIYRCGHPSGYFFRCDIVKKDEKLVDAFDKNSIFYNNPFISDLLYAVGLASGYESIYNGTLVIPESLDKAKETKSYTYSKENSNIYFFPVCKRKQFFLLLSHLKLLGIDEKKQQNIAERLFRRTMLDCTVNYRKIMRNQAICAHHGIEKKNITYREMIHEATLLSDEFMHKESIEFLRYKKIKMIILAWTEFFVKFIIKR